jgi:hypothetical protein
MFHLDVKKCRFDKCQPYVFDHQTVKLIKINSIHEINNQEELVQKQQKPPSNRPKP